MEKQTPNVKDEVRSKSKSRNKFERRGGGSNKPTNRGNVTGRYPEMNMALEHSSNDIAWYAKNAQVLKDAASLSFNQPLGSSLYTGVLGSAVYPGAATARLPGILRLDFSNAVGMSVEAVSPINIAARDIYSWVRHANSGSKNYESPDLMLYILAVREAYGIYFDMRRAYGVAMMYGRRNYYFGRALTEACGFDYDDILNHLSEFRSYINTYAARISAWAVPGDIALFRRTAFMTDSIYADDSDLGKAQLYVFNRRGEYIYDEFSGAGQLVYKPVDLNRTYDLIREEAEALIQPLLASEDIGIMSGDILKAYGEDKLFKLSPIDESYRPAILFDPVVLMQIENATLCGEPIPSSMNIHQENQQLIFNPKFAEFEGFANIPTRYMINCHSADPSPAEVMEATRLLTVLSHAGVFTPGISETGGFITRGVQHCGSELIHSATIIGLNNAGLPQEWGTVTNQVSIISSTSTAGSGVNFAPFLISKFDWHPRFYLVNEGAYGSDNATWGNPDWSYLIGDIDNFTVVDSANVERLHLCAIMSMLNIPIKGFD